MKLNNAHSCYRSKVQAHIGKMGASLVAQTIKYPPAMQKTWVRSLSWEDPLEKGKDTHSSILAWRIPWTIQSMGSQRIGHNRANFTHSLGEKLNDFP